MPINQRMEKKKYFHTMEYHYAIKGDKFADTCYAMNEPQNFYAK